MQLSFFCVGDSVEHIHQLFLWIYIIYFTRCLILKKVYTFWLIILLQVYTFFLNPKYRLHLFYYIKQKGAMPNTNKGVTISYLLILLQCNARRSLALHCFVIAQLFFYSLHSYFHQLFVQNKFLPSFLLFLLTIACP